MMSLVTHVFDTQRSRADSSAAGPTYQALGLGDEPVQRLVDGDHGLLAAALPGDQPAQQRHVPVGDEGRAAMLRLTQRCVHRLQSNQRFLLIPFSELPVSELMPVHPHGLLHY